MQVTTQWTPPRVKSLPIRGATGQSDRAAPSRFAHQEVKRIGLRRAKQRKQNPRHVARGSRIAIPLCLGIRDAPQRDSAVPLQPPGRHGRLSRHFRGGR
jgi:hypothetical protein